MNIKPVIAVPMERTISQHAFFGFVRIAQRGYPFIQLEYTRNDIARNKFAKHLLNSDFTHLLMLDSDHIHPADIVERLVKRFEADPEKQVIGGMNFRRGEPFEPCAFFKGDNDTAYAMADWEPGSLIKVDLLGSGSIMIAREVFEKIPMPWFAYDYGGVERDAFPGVDIYFSRRCNEAGIDLWVDTAISSPHLLDKAVVDESVYRQYLAANKDKYEIAET